MLSFLNKLLKIKTSNESSPKNWISEMKQELLTRGFVDNPSTIKRIKEFSEEEVQELVHAYLYSHSPGLGSLIIYVIERAEPILLNELGKVQSYQRADPKNIDRFDNKAVVEKILRLYTFVTPISYVPYLRKYFNHSDKRIRQEIALHIANSGSKIEFEFLQKILDNPQSEEKFQVLIGLKRAVGSQILSPNDLSQFYECLFKLLLHENAFLLIETDIEILNRINKKQLLDDLVSRLDYSYNNKNLDAILRKATKLQIKLSADRLFLLLELYKREIIYSRKTGIYCECLKALALVKDSRVIEHIKNIKKEKTSSEEANVDSFRNARLHRRKAAKEAQSILEDLNNIVTILWDYKNKHGYMSLPQIGQDILNIIELDAEVSNGGFSQYFFNSSGDYANDALISLERHKLSSHAKIFRSVIDIMGIQLLVTNRTKRIDKLHKLSAEAFSNVSKYESQWFDLNSIDEEVQSIINKHVKELRNFLQTT